jgi:hypothetical protein
MYRVTVDHVNPIDAIGLKNQLLADGLILNQDFTWEYCPARYDDSTFITVTPKRSVFKFAKASLATFYQLKWAR